MSEEGLGVCQELSQYYNMEEGKCANCIENCLTCWNGSSCQQCMVGYFAVKDLLQNRILCVFNQKSVYFQCFGNQQECTFEENLIHIFEYIFLFLILLMVLLWIATFLKKKSRQTSILYSVMSLQQFGVLYLLSLHTLGVSNLFFNRLYQIFNFFPIIPKSKLDSLISEKFSIIEEAIYSDYQNANTSKFIMDIMGVFKLSEAFLDNSIYIFLIISAALLYQLVISLLSKVKPCKVADRLTLKPEIIIRGMLLVSTQLIVSIFTQCLADYQFLIKNIPNIIAWSLSLFLLLCFYLKFFWITKRMNSEYYQTEKFISTYTGLFTGLNVRGYYFLIQQEGWKFINIFLIIQLRDQQLLCSIVLFINSVLFLLFLMKKNPFQDQLMRSYVVFDKVLDIVFKSLLICVCYSQLKGDNIVVKYSSVLILILLFIIALNCIFSLLSLSIQKTEISTTLLHSSSSSSSSG